MYEEHISENFASPRAFRHAMRSKAAPKLGRTIGAAARAGKRVVPFDPNARNADGDLTVQDGTIWERPATPNVQIPNVGTEKLSNNETTKGENDVPDGLSSGKSVTLSDRLIDREIDDEEDIPAEWYELAGLIDDAIMEQIKLTTGEITPDLATATLQLVNNYEAPPGKRKPSALHIIKNALDRFNEDTGENKKLEELVSDAIDSSPTFVEHDAKIRNHFFSSDRSRLEFNTRAHKQKDYKYGERSVITGREIRSDSTDWLSGLTPRQIARLVVPESIEDAYDIFLDYKHGRKDAELARAAADYRSQVALFRRDALTTFVGKSKIKMVESGDEEKEKLRNLIEKILTDNPEFLAAVHKFGMPPILPVTPEYGMVGLQDLVGWYTPAHRMIFFQADGIDEALGNDEFLDGLIASGVDPNSVEAQLTRMTHIGSTRMISHEWAHYLQDTIQDKSRQQNGLKKSGSVKYDVDLDDIAKLGHALASQIWRDGAKIQIAPEQLSISPRIMQEARSYSGDFAAIIADFHALWAKNIISALKSDAEPVDPVENANKIKDLENRLARAIRDSEARGVIAAPTRYGTINESEQFAELVSFFISGPETRALLTPTARKEMEELFKSVLSKDYKSVPDGESGLASGKTTKKKQKIKKPSAGEVEKYGSSSYGGYDLSEPDNPDPDPSIPEDVVNAARTHREEIVEVEEAMTRELIDVANAHNGTMAGLAFRLKSLKSLARKVFAEKDEDKFGGDPLKAARGMRDVVRYTMLFDPDSYVEDVKRVVMDLLGKGYELEIKNYWKPIDPGDLTEDQRLSAEVADFRFLGGTLEETAEKFNMSREEVRQREIRYIRDMKDKPTYKGINVAAKHPSGINFELQFHTPFSHDMKENQIHIWYEKYRVEKDPMLRYYYWNQMVKLVKQVTVPGPVEDLLQIGNLRIQPFSEKKLRVILSSKTINQPKVQS